MLNNQTPTKIASFTVDHDFIKEGIYVSRIDGDIVTYDLRTRVPNAGDYLDDVTMHSVEHMLATFLRSSAIKDNVIYFGPMGCRTGFYLLTRDTLSKTDAIALVKESMAFARDFEGEIPGSKKEECGNYLDHDLAGAKALGKEMAAILENWTEKDLTYKE
jgi:S-ribosylhomocysteine lyase